MKTSKKLISIIVAVALLISTIAAVTTLTSSAATTKVSVWDGTFSKIEGAYKDQTSKAVITKNADDSVTAALPADLIGQQYQFQLSIASFDKDKIVAAGNKVILEFQINSAKKSSGADDNAEVKINGLAGGKDLSWTNHDKKTINLDFTNQNWESTYNAIVVQNYSNGSGLKDVTITVGFYVEEEATAETTTATPVVETTTATPVVETTTADPSTLVKKAFYNFKPTNTGDTFKTEGWIASESYWGPTADLTVACQKDGSVFYSTAAAKVDFYSQINTDWKNVPSVTGKEVFMDFTNNLSVAVKVKLHYSDANTTVIPAGETKTLKVTAVSDKGVLNIMIQNNGGNVPVKENSFKISALYTLEPGDPSTTAAPETTEEETEPETTTKKVVDPASYTAGAYYSKYANLHYAKAEGWYSGAKPIGDSSSYITVDPKGVFTYNVPAGVMSAQQVYANYSQDGSENARMVAAVEAAKAGSGYLMFDLTVNEAKDKNGKDTTVGFKYENLAGQGLPDSQMVALTAGTTKRILVDVTNSNPDTFKKNSFRMYFKNNNDWNGGLTVLNVTATPIVVAVDPTAVETTTVVETEPETTTEAEPETTTEAEPETTTEAEPETTTEAVVEKTNPVSDADFTLVDENTPDDAFVVALDDVMGEVGETVEFSAYVFNNPGLFAANMAIKYDSDVIRPVCVKMGSDMVVDGTAGDVLPSVTFGPASEVLDENGNELGYQVTQFILENTGMSNATDDGVLFTIKFEIVGKPVYGDTTNVVFTLPDETSFYGIDLDTLGNTVLNPVFAEGSVTVVEETEPETTTEAVEPTTETPAEPTTETPAEPTTEFVKPELVSEAEFAPYDAEMFNIVVDEVTGKAGETVDVNITINNNPGIWAGALFLAYDPAVINPVEIPDPTGGDYNVVPYSNVMEGFVADNGYPVDYTVDGYNFKMIAVSVNNPMNFNNITTDGVLATVTFKIAEGAEADDFSNIVFVNFAESKFNNNAGQKYEFAIKEGKVTVLGEPTQPETTTEAPVEPTTVAPVVPATTTAAAEVETPDATTVAPEATTAANGGNSSTPNDDVPTGAAAAPFAALALAAGAAFVAFKARKK